MRGSNEVVRITDVAIITYLEIVRALFLRKHLTVDIISEAEKG